MYDARGAPVGEVTFRGHVPVLEAGANVIGLARAGLTNAGFRADTTAISRRELP